MCAKRSEPSQWDAGRLGQEASDDAILVRVRSSSGVAIDGAKILIKSGGAPGSLALPTSPDVLETAAANGSAFVANCPGAKS